MGPKYKVGDHVKLRSGYWGVIKEIESVQGEFIYSVDVDDFHGYINVSDQYFQGPGFIGATKCECGAHAVKFMADADAHAYYCPRYTRGVI